MKKLLFISFLWLATLALYNLSGSKVLESSQNQIETSALASGIYLAQINSRKHAVSRKIMINR